jgi:hypothetical protein
MTRLGEGGMLNREGVYTTLDQRMLKDDPIPSLNYLALIQGKDFRCMSSCIFTSVPNFWLRFHLEIDEYRLKM